MIMSLDLLTNIKYFCNLSAPISEACCLKPLFVRIIMTVLSVLSFINFWVDDNFKLFVDKITRT